MNNEGTPSKPYGSEVFKQAFLALLTGGMSLLWLLAKKLPQIWETTWILRAEWISSGRNPRDWRWIARGWLATLGTCLVTLPGSLMLGSLGTLVFKPKPFLPGHISASALLMALLFLLTLFSMVGLFCTYFFHTLRMSVLFIWASIRPHFTPRSA